MRKLYYAITYFISRHTPVFCAGCQMILFRKNASFVRHRINGFVPLCPTCYQDLYNPWEDAK